MDDISKDFNIEKFEPIFVKGIISDPNVLAVLGPFFKNTKELFKDKNYTLLVNYTKLFFDKYEKLPIKDELELHIKDKVILENLKTAYNGLDNVNYKDFDKTLFFTSAEKFIKARSIWSTIIDIANNLDKGQVSPNEILEKFESICSISVDNDSGLDLYNDIDKVISYFGTKLKTISTGYKSIDKYIDGGMYAEGRALYMFMAPPNKGKSLFLGNLACNLADQGKTVVVISLEMSEMAYASRFCSQQASVPFCELHLRPDEVRNNLKNKQGKIIIKEFPPSSLTVEQLKAWIKNQLVKRHIHFDCLVIDYLNLLTGPGNNLYERIKMITEKVRALSYYFSVPVWTCTQENRSASGKEFTGMNSVSESLGIAMTADVLLEIFQNDEDRAINIYRLGFVKNRYGPVGMAITTKINYETLRITDLDEETYYSTNLNSDMEQSLELL